LVLWSIATRASARRSGQRGLWQVGLLPTQLLPKAAACPTIDSRKDAGLPQLPVLLPARRGSAGETRSGVARTHPRRPGCDPRGDDRFGAESGLEGVIALSGRSVDASSPVRLALLIRALRQLVG